MNKKILSIAFASILILSITITLVALPATNAHTPGWQLPTYMYVSVSPNPIGIGQTVYIVLLG